ncbi:hypothetical protein TKK_0011963 [Trichogramma kaykai]
MASPSERMAKPSQDSVIYMDELASGHSRSASPSIRLSSRPSSPVVVDESQSHPQLHPHVSERSLVPYDTHHLQAELLHSQIARRRNSEYDEDLTHDAELVDPEYIFDENGDGKRDDGSHRNNNRPAGGIDDGLFDDNDDEERRLHGPSSPRLRPGNDYPAAFPAFGGGTTAPTPDMNVYQQKKTIAQGMMDLALISANANQFRYVLQSSGQHPYYYPSLTMIGLSLFLQVVVGIGLIWNSRYNVKVDEQMCKANRANNWTVICVFLVTILNVFISSFGVVDNVLVAVQASDNLAPVT